MSTRETMIEKAVDYAIGQAIEKLEPIPEKPGLYKLPEFEILGKKINLGEIAFKPKEGNALIINKGNQLESFLCIHKGYCFLHELFPTHYGKRWDHEKNKWWCVQIPQSPEKVEKIVDFLKKITGTTKSKNLSFLSQEDVDYLKEKSGNYEFQEAIEQVLEEDALEEIYEKTGYLVFQNLTFQKTPGFRKISFSQFDEKSAGSVLHREELSPYYRLSFFPYAFIVPEAEDANNIPTKVSLTIRAQCVNPYIAHVQSGNAFMQFHSTVLNAVTEVIRGNFVHEMSRQIAMEKLSDEKKKELNQENVIKKIQEKVKKELTKPESFFGFDFGDCKNSEIVQIIDIDIVGEKAAEIKAQVAENFRLKNERENAVEKSIVQKTIAKNEAEVQFIELNAEMNEIKKATAKCMAKQHLKILKNI